MATVKKKRKEQVLVRRWRNWNTRAPFVGLSNDTTAVDGSRAVPQKIKNRIGNYYPANPLLSPYPVELKGES